MPGRSTKVDSQSRGWYRTSPFGGAEVIVDPEYYDLYGLGTNEHGQKISARSHPSGVVYYRQDTENDPVVTTHERIHQGQHRQKRHPGLGYLRSMVGDAPEPYGRPVYEIPAYAFEQVNPHWAQQKAFNDYLNTMHAMNPETSAALEAPMPEPLLRRYVESTPRPVPFPNPATIQRGRQAVQQKSIIDVILGR